MEQYRQDDNRYQQQDGYGDEQDYGQEAYAQQQDSNNALVRSRSF